MRSSLFIAILFFVQFTTSCNREVKKPVVVTKQVVLEEIVEEVPPPPPPPPPGRAKPAPKYKNLQDWLLKFCDLDKPDKSIIAYVFAVFEYKGNFTVIVAGSREYDEEKTAIKTVDFQSPRSQFNLPPAEYKGLNIAQAQQKISLQLKDFISNGKFKNSCFSNAEAMITDYDRVNLLR